MEINRKKYQLLCQGQADAGAISQITAAIEAQRAAIQREEGPSKLGIRYLPNVKEFKITTLYPLDQELFAETGIKKRLLNAAYDTQPWTNGGMNRYVKKQFEILWRYQQGNRILGTRRTSNPSQRKLHDDDGKPSIL